MDVTPEFLGLVFASCGAAPSEMRAAGFQGVSEIQRQVSDPQSCHQKQMRLGLVQTKEQQHNEYCTACEQPWVGFSQMMKKIAEHVPPLSSIGCRKVAGKLDPHFLGQLAQIAAGADPHLWKIPRLIERSP